VCILSWREVNYTENHAEKKGEKVREDVIENGKELQYIRGAEPLSGCDK
jgi:hypothetical protein